MAVALAGVFAAVGPSALAQTAAPAPAPAKPATTNTQQDRMKACNEKAAGKKGDEHKAYMKTCLSGKEPEPKLTAQQQRMKDCNVKAADKKGDDRKKFMSECLKG
jgi:psiF repeat